MNNYQNFLSGKKSWIDLKVKEIGLLEEIPQNEAQYPTEIREEIVKTIVSKMLIGYTIDIDREYKVLYYDKDYDVFTSRGTKDGCIRIHGIEVQAAFYALQVKGYFIKKLETGLFVTYELKRLNSHECQDIPYMVFDYNIDA